MPRRKKLNKAVSQLDRLALTPVQSLFARQLAENYDVIEPLPEPLLTLVRRLEQEAPGAI
jgi:hypothetical protein